MKILFVQKARLGRFEMAAGLYFPVELARLGHEVMVAAPAGGDASAHVAAGVWVAEIEDGLNWLVGLRRLAKAFQPDIVHVFIHAGCGIYPFAMRLGFRVPKFVLDIRSPLLRTGWLRRMIRIKNRFEIVGYRLIFTPSQESGRTVVGQAVKLTTLPFGVDFSVLPSIVDQEVKNNDCLRLIYIGSIDVKRQLELMIEAVCRVKKSIPVSLDLYGDGNAMPQLKELVDRLGMQDYAHFRGKVDRKALLGAIGDYDAGLAYIPGEMYNAAPALKTLEYLACGIYVIATDTDGNRMLVHDGKNGILAGGAAEEYAAGIMRFATERARLLSPGELRQEVVQYDWRTIVSSRLLPAYRQLWDKEQGPT